MTRISDMTALNALPAAGAFAPVEVPGSTENWRYDLSKLSSRLDGLFADAASRAVPTGTDMVSTTGYSSLGVGAANYVYDAAVDVAYVAAHPRSSFLTENARGFRLDHEQDITPQIFGAAANGVTDDSAAFVAAIAYLKAFALNTGGSGFYKGSPKLFIPAGHYYLGTTALDINHTLVIEGEGSGQFGPGAGGCSRLRWAAGTSGLRIQAANTSGNTTIDGTTHDGAGGVVIRDLCLQGGFVATEGEYHGLVIRNAVKAENLYITNWQGEGVKAWAGNVVGQPSLAGNVSTTRLVGVKTEGCRGGFDIRGSDSNVVTTINCEGYQNRWFGLLDENGAGANTHIGMHCASNGVVTGTWPQTQCSSGGNRYAAKWGGDPTVAPSGTTADTANWLYIIAGAAVTNLIPAHTATANTFRAGGDYLTLSSAGAIFVNPYSETGGFSQFTPYTQIELGALTPPYFRGGTQQLPSGDGGRMIKSGRLNNNFYLDTDGTEAGIFPRNNDGTGGFGYLDFAKGGGAYLNGLDGCHFRHAGAACGGIDNSGLNLQAGQVVKVNSTQVVGARQTGWTAATGTPVRGAFAAAAAGTVSAAYVQAEAQASRDRIAALEARFIALEADARAHGLIN